jgi:steroid delta-isomerase-like uncharacterized protein
MRQGAFPSHPPEIKIMNAIEVAQRFFNAWDTQDADAIVAAFAKGGTYQNPDTGQALIGEAIATFAKGVWAAFPDFSTELISIGESGGGLVTYRWVMRGTNTGPGLDGSPPTGRPLTLTGATFVQVEGEKIRSVQDYFDRKTVDEQLGTLGDIRKDSMIKANLATVEAHFHNEALNEIEKACDLYTDDIVWEAPARHLLLRNKQDTIDNYRKMFASAKDVEFRNLQRFATVDRVVDDSIARCKIIGPHSLPVPIGSEIEMRLVHIFEMREAKIAREIAFEMWKVV